MNINSAQVFASVAVLVGLAVSYYPPAENGAAIWMLVGAFVNHAMAQLFKDPPDDPPPSSAATM